MKTVGEEARPEGSQLKGRKSIPKADSAGGVLGKEAVSLSLLEGLGKCCKLTAGFGAEPDRPKGFHYFQHSGWLLPIP